MLVWAIEERNCFLPGTLIRLRGTVGRPGRKEVMKLRQERSMT